MLRVLLIVFLVVAAEHENRAVPLSSIQSLVLRNGHMTTARRGSPIPQITCVGCGSDVLADQVFCQNKGNENWECTAKLNRPDLYGMKDAYVNCEGYLSPEDSNVLEGSCGVEIYVRPVSETATKKPIEIVKGSGIVVTTEQHSNNKPLEQVSPNTNKNDATVALIIVCMALVLFVIIVARCCVDDNNRQVEQQEVVVVEQQQQQPQRYEEEEDDMPLPRSPRQRRVLRPRKQVVQEHTTTVINNNNNSNNNDRYWPGYVHVSQPPAYYAPPPVPVATVPVMAAASSSSVTVAVEKDKPKEESKVFASTRRR